MTKVGETMYMGFGHFIIHVSLLKLKNIQSQDCAQVTGNYFTGIGYVVKLPGSVSLVVDLVISSSEIDFVVDK